MKTLYIFLISLLWIGFAMAQPTSTGSRSLTVNTAGVTYPLRVFYPTQAKASPITPTT